MTLFRHLPVFCIVAASLVGCSSTSRDDALLTELADMDKTAIFNKAEDLYTRGKVLDARKYFSFVYDTFPNDPLGHKAALRVADTYSVKKDTASLTEARLRYRDFANRYPNDPDRDYALLMVGQTYSARNMKPDRDLTSVHEAMNAYRQLATLYPNSTYYDEAQDRIAKLNAVLAEHELITAQFYARTKRWHATEWRVEYLKENYPDYERMDEADALLEKAKHELDITRERIKKMLDERRAQAEAANEKAAENTTTSDGGDAG